MTDTFSVTITGSNNDSNLVLGSASASITESAGTHSHAVDTVPHLTTADVNGLITANETAKQAADDAATTAAADLLKVQTDYEWFESMTGNDILTSKLNISYFL